MKSCENNESPLCSWNISLQLMQCNRAHWPVERCHCNSRILLSYLSAEHGLNIAFPPSGCFSKEHPSAITYLAHTTVKRKRHRPSSIHTRFSSNASVPTDNCCTCIFRLRSSYAANDSTRFDVLCTLTQSFVEPVNYSIFVIEILVYFLHW